MISILQSIFNVVLFFFKNAFEKKKQEIGIAEAREKSAIETIRASENAMAVAQMKNTSDAVTEIKKVQAERNRADAKKSVDDQFDKQFSMDK